MTSGRKRLPEGKIILNHILQRVIHHSIIRIPSQERGVTNSADVSLIQYIRKSYSETGITISVYESIIIGQKMGCMPLVAVK